MSDNTTGEITFLQYLINERIAAKRALEEEWISLIVQERVAIENLLIAYDQAVLAIAAAAQLETAELYGRPEVITPYVWAKMNEVEQSKYILQTFYNVHGWQNSPFELYAYSAGIYHLLRFVVKDTPINPNVEGKVTNLTNVALDYMQDDLVGDKQDVYVNGFYQGHAHRITEVQQLQAEIKMFRDALCEQHKVIQDIRQQRDDYATRHTEIVDELQAEIKRLRNPWISVDDRLPDHYWEVLTMFTKGDYTSCQVGKLYDRERKSFTDPTGESGINVTHWQPLTPLTPQ